MSNALTFITGTVVGGITTASVFCFVCVCAAYDDLEKQKAKSEEYLQNRIDELEEQVKLLEAGYKE